MMRLPWWLKRYTTLTNISKPWYSLESSEYRRLLYRASYRGMRETELILRAFLPARWEAIGETVQPGQLEAFLEEDDPDIMRWINAKAPTPEEYQNLIAMINTFIKKTK